MGRLSTWLLILTGLGSGCAASYPGFSPERSLPDGFPNHSVEEILDRLPPYPASLTRLFAESRIALSSPEESGRFSAKISYVHPESLFVRVTFPLGIEGARVRVTPDSAWVYDRIENVVWTGSPARVAAMLPGAVAGLHLVEMATGFEQPDADTEWRVQTDATLYVLTSTDGTRRLTVDPTLWRIVAVKEMHPNGDIIEQRWYSDFTSVHGVLLPRRMALSRPADTLRMSMAWGRIDPDPPRLGFDLNVAPDAQWIDLGGE